MKACCLFCASLFTVLSKKGLMWTVRNLFNCHTIIYNTKTISCTIEVLHLSHIAWHIDSFPYGNKCSFLCKTFLFLPCNMAAVLELHIMQRQLESPWRQLTIWNKALCYCTTTHTQCVPFSSKDDRIFFFLTNDYLAGSQRDSAGTTSGWPLKWF